MGQEPTPDLRDTPFFRAYQRVAFWVLVGLCALSGLIGVVGLAGPAMRFVLNGRPLVWSEIQGSLVVLLVSLIGVLAAIASRREVNRRAAAVDAARAGEGQSMIEE